VGIGEPYYIAQNIAGGFGYSLMHPFAHSPEITCFIPPLYVGFHLLLLYIGLPIIVGQIVGLLFFHAAAITIYSLMKQVTRPALALIGFIALECYLPLWIVTQKLEPDGLNMFLVALTLWMVYHLKSKPTWRSWILLGVLYGIQLLVRPDILLGIAVFGAWLIISSKEKEKYIKGYAISCIVALLIVAPWTIRNYSEFGKFVLVSANSGYNLYLGNNINATGEMPQNIATQEGENDVELVDKYFQEHHSDVERDAFLLALSKEWMMSHPLDVMRLAGKKFIMHWWRRGNAGSEVESKPWMMIGYDIVTIYILIFGFIGLFSLQRKDFRSLILSLFLYSSAISVIFFVQSRHRALKVDPYLVPLSIIGIDFVIRKFSKKEHAV
jgi:4-amino-4-deoxy-L-arabinose transferase-like glycosyltransferase